MNNEFKKITNKNETRYILETATAGATSTGVGATAPTDVGSLRRRFKEIKEKIETIKVKKLPPRKGTPTPQTGAGAHRDKKKEQKQGVEKHKKPYFEDNDEGPNDSSRSIFRDKPDVRPWPGNVSDTELSNVDPQDHDDMEGSFVKNQIHTMLRVLKHLDHALGDEEDLPEWVQMKISQAQQTVVGVMNFIISDKERDVEKQTGDDVLMKEQGVAEKMLPKSAFAGSDKNKLGPAAHLKGSMKRPAKAGDLVGGMEEDELNEYETHTYKDSQGNVWRVNDEGERELLRAAPGSSGGGGRYGSRYPRPTYSRPSYPSRPSEVKKDYHLVNTATGKILSKNGVPSVFNSETHATNVANRLQFGTWKPVPVTQDVSESKKRCPQCGMTNCTCAPGKCGCKPIAGWVPNKGFKKATDEQSVAEEKIKGVDGKACWKGKRYAGTKNGKDVCVPVGEDTYINHLMAALESKK